MLSVTQVREFSKALATNATDTSFASKVPTLTEPTNDGVITLSSGGTVAENIVLIPFGTGADDTTLDLRIIGWSKISTLWIPVVLATLNVTLSTVVGVAAAAVLNTERFADTLVLVAGYTTTAVEVTSPTGNIVAHARVSVQGFSKIEVCADLTGASSANCLYRTY